MCLFFAVILVVLMVVDSGRVISLTWQITLPLAAQSLLRTELPLAATV